MVNLELALSRPLATAQALSELAEDTHRFLDKRVMLTGATDVLATRNGRECLLSSLRLLVRICPNLTVELPEGRADLASECEKLGQQIAFGPPVQFQAATNSFSGYDAILSVGNQGRRNLPWTVINSNGWLARICSTGDNLPSECNQWNPIGALAASSLGVSEVFKRLIKLKERRGPLLEATVFSLWSYSTGGNEPGPSLSDRIEVDLTLFGVGAIGNGIVHLLRLLPLEGRIDVVDRQSFGPENLGTCFLIGPAEVQQAIPKALFAETLLATNLRATGFNEPISEYARRLANSIPLPRVILNALDNIDARHDAQAIWPDIIIDGAIGPFECQVSCHPWGPDVACLRCLFRHPSPSADSIATRATGLPAERIHNPDAVVTDADVERAPAGRRQYLERRLGRQICSVVQEAIAKQISDDSLPENFEPSVPFVATMSAAMVVGELIRYTMGSRQVLVPRFQFDLLTGSAHGQQFAQHRRQDCVCTARRGNIDRVRQRRVNMVASL